MNVNIEIKRNKNQLPVPVVNGVTMHSIHDPYKEAEQKITEFTTESAGKTNVLVLGLGFAYHIEQLISFFQSKNTTFEIFVIEPSSQLIDLFKTERNLNLANTKILSYDKIEDYFSNLSLINFLSTKPGILKLETSFVANDSFFKSFLSYKGEKNIANFLNELSPHLKTYFETRGLNTNTNISKYSDEIKTRGVVSHQNDFLILALEELIKTTRHVQQGN